MKSVEVLLRNCWKMMANSYENGNILMLTEELHLFPKEGGKSKYDLLITFIFPHIWLFLAVKQNHDTA